LAENIIPCFENLQLQLGLRCIRSADIVAIMKSYTAPMCWWGLNHSTIYTAAPVFAGGKRQYFLVVKFWPSCTRWMTRRSLHRITPVTYAA